jgi:adenine deaminase
VSGSIFPGTVRVEGGRIRAVRPEDGSYERYVLPGLVDAHVHVESSMLVPTEFARLAVVHGTVAVVADPHEIANVLGMRGVQFMMDNARRSPFKFAFGAPSCVPATSCETAGAVLGPEEVESLLQRDEIKCLGEVMSWSGVFAGDPVPMSKIRLARRYGKPVDGHAPQLRGRELEAYVEAGITTDHECVALDEGREKLGKGMTLILREGSAAQNFDSLAPLIEDFPDRCMLCTDDLHPDDLARGHIDVLVRRALHRGLDPMKILRAASLNPIRHYGLEVGLLQEGDPADLIVADDLDAFRILETYIDGRQVAARGESHLPQVAVETLNRFAATAKRTADFATPHGGNALNVIEALDGQLFTNHIQASPALADDRVVSDVDADVLKFVVVNRYEDAPPAIGFLKGFGLEAGAIASSVGHDSHNVLAVGVSDEDLCTAVNLVIEQRGGLAVVSPRRSDILPLPVAGLMSTEDGARVAEEYHRLEERVKALGSPLRSPFITLSFMALLVSPSLKLSDRGLFDVKRGRFVPLFADSRASPDRAGS